MTPDERRAQFQAILTRHDDAARALRRSMEGDARAHDSLDQVARDIREANHAVREATDVMLAANRAALALFTDQDGDEPKDR